MLVLALLAVALVGGIAVLGLGGVTMTRERDGFGPVVTLVGGAVVLVLVVAGGGLLLGAGVDGGSTDSQARSDAVVPSSTPTAPTAPTPPTSARVDSVGFPGLGPGVTVRAAAVGELPAPSVATGRLSDGDIVPVTAAGFGRNADGTARQCALRAGGRSCTPTIPVRFDERGAAEFLFLVGSETGSDARRVDCMDATCVLEVRDARGRAGVAALVFGDPAPVPPVIEVADRTVGDGGLVAVTIRGLAPREHVQVVQCAATDEGHADCGAPATEMDVTADSRGEASLTVPLRVGRVGSDARVECTRRTTCGVAVVHADGLLRAAPVVVTLSAGPSADYDGARLAIGLLLAAALAAGAVLLGVRTDWRGGPDPFA